MSSAVPAELQVGVDALLERRQTQVVEPSAFDLREGLRRELRQRGAAPETDRLTDRVRCVNGIAGCERGAPFLDEPLETDQVDVLRLDLEHVARRARHERSIGQQLAKP